MAKLRLSKNSLQQQQQQLKLYKRLLPSLDLKRRQLTVEAQKARAEHKAALAAAETLDAQIGAELPMLADAELDLGGLVEMTGYRVGEQNVVGTRLPILEHVEFAVADYSRLATPAWVDILVQRLKDAAAARVRARIAGQRVQVLDLAVRRITQRVNLFEKIKIPEAKEAIRVIRIQLGDALTAAANQSGDFPARTAAVATTTLTFTDHQAGDNYVVEASTCSLPVTRPRSVASVALSMCVVTPTVRANSSRAAGRTSLAIRRSGWIRPALTMPCARAQAMRPAPTNPMVGCCAILEAKG